MIDRRTSRERRHRQIKSYANQIISLENLQLNDYAKYKVMKLQASKDKNKKNDYDSKNHTQKQFRNMYRSKDFERDYSPSNSPTQRKSIIQNNQDHESDFLKKENTTLKQKIDNLKNKVKSLKQKNQELIGRNQEQFKSTREDCGEEYNYKEIQSVKKMYQQLSNKHKKLESNFEFLTKQHHNCIKSIAQMKKFVNFQNEEICNLKQKLKNHQRLIRQNQDDYISLIETLNKKNQEEQNLIQKIKNLQRKQEFESIVEKKQKMKQQAYNRLSQGLIKLKPHRQHSEQKKSLKVKVSELKLSKVVDSKQELQEELEDTLYEIRRIEQRNKEILIGRQSTGNYKLQNGIEGKDNAQEDSFETSYESEENFSKTNNQITKSFIIPNNNSVAFSFEQQGAFQKKFSKIIQFYDCYVLIHRTPFIPIHTSNDIFLLRVSKNVSSFNKKYAKKHGIFISKPFFNSPQKASPEFQSFFTVFDMQVNINSVYLLHSKILEYTTVPFLKSGLFFLVAPSKSKQPNTAFLGAQISNQQQSPCLFSTYPITRSPAFGKQLIVIGTNFI